MILGTNKGQIAHKVAFVGAKTEVGIPIFAGYYQESVSLHQLNFDFPTQIFYS